MVAKTEAYVDTSALISLIDKSDTYHTLFARIFVQPPALVTSPLVIAEGQAWCLRRYDSSRALKFMDLIEQMKSLKVLSAGATQLNAAASVLRRFSDQALTLADALGLHLMADRQIKVCWSTDFHMGITGVPLVIHQSR